MIPQSRREGEVGGEGYKEVEAGNTYPIIMNDVTASERGKREKEKMRKRRGRGERGDLPSTRKMLLAGE